MVKKTSSNKKASVKKKETVKSKATVEPPVVKTPEPVEAPVVSEPKEETNDFMVYSELSDMKTRLKVLVNMARELSTMVTQLERRVSKDKKLADKKMKKKVKSTDGKKALNGFSKPGQVSSELRTFMGLDSEELVARVDVTKFITKYCKDNGLHDDKDKRILLPDAKLKSLLNVEKGVQLTYFNLQKYLKFHFPDKDGNYPKA